MTFAQFKKTIPRIKKKMQGWPYKAIIIDGRRALPARPLLQSSCGNRG